MNRKFKQWCLKMAVAMAMLIALPFQSFAANAKIAFSDPSAQAGSEVSVTMKFTSTSGGVLGDTNVMLAYDATMLEYVGGSENVNGGSGALRVTSGMEGKTEIVSTLKFKALKAGTTQITVSSWEGYDSDGQMLTLDKQGSSTVTVTAPAAASNDAALKTLQISPGTLDPAFSPDVEAYTASVGLDTEKVFISALPNSDKATVTVEGDSGLVDGENTVVCRVSAEDGTTIKSYTITVNRVEGGESAAPAGEGEAAGAGLEVLAQLEASKVPLKIGITTLPEGVSAPAGLTERTITIGQAKVQGWVPQADGEPAYCVLYGVNESGTQGFYRYDMADRTIQRYFQETETATPELMDIAQKYNDLVDDYSLVKWIAVAAMAFAVVLLIVLIVTLVMSSKRKQGQSGPYRSEPEKKPAARVSRASGGKKLSREERYMMGEEEEYVEEDAPVGNAARERQQRHGGYNGRMPDAGSQRERYLPEEYLPEADQAGAGMAGRAVPVESVERSLEAKLAREMAAAAAVPEDGPQEDNDFDFEVFDLDDDR